MAQPAHADAESRTRQATSHSETENKGQAAATESRGSELTIKAAGASSARQVDDMLRRSGTVGAEATQTSTQVGIQAAQHSARALAEGYRQLLEQSAEQLGTIGRHMAQSLQENASVVGNLVSVPA